MLCWVSYSEENQALYRKRYQRMQCVDYPPKMNHESLNNRLLVAGGSLKPGHIDLSAKVSIYFILKASSPGFDRKQTNLIQGKLLKDLLRSSE